MCTWSLSFKSFSLSSSSVRKVVALNKRLLCLVYGLRYVLRGVRRDVCSVKCAVCRVVQRAGGAGCAACSGCNTWRQILWKAYMRHSTWIIDMELKTAIKRPEQGQLQYNCQPTLVNSRLGTSAVTLPSSARGGWGSRGHIYSPGAASSCSRYVPYQGHVVDQPVEDIPGGL